MPITSAVEATTAGQAVPGGVNAAPLSAKYASQVSAATPCVHATITSGGISRARPLTTANCAAWVTAAPSERANQLRRA